MGSFSYLSIANKIITIKLDMKELINKASIAITNSQIHLNLLN